MKTFELTLEEAKVGYLALLAITDPDAVALKGKIRVFLDSEAPGWIDSVAYALSCPFGLPQTNQQALYSMSQMAEELGMTEGALIKACVDNGLLNDVLKTS